jgi:hypothetical protein
MHKAHSSKAEKRKALDKGRNLLAKTWETQLNLSLFLALLVATAFVMPALGFERPYRILVRDLTFSVILISGVTIAWGRRRRPARLQSDADPPIGAQRSFPAA